MHCNDEVKNIYTGQSAIFEDTTCTPLALDLKSPGSYEVGSTEIFEQQCLTEHKAWLVFKVGDNANVSVDCENS